MKFPFFQQRENSSKVFFGIFLKEREGIGILMKIEGAKDSLIDQEKFSYSNGWENLTEDIDEVILKLEQRAKIRINETIFYVYSHFIDVKTKEIKKPYLQKIKDLVKKLNLKALGYIECYEAVVYFIEKKEDLPLTAVLVELDHTNLSVFVYKRGELIYSKVLAHTDNLIDDLLTSFLEIKGKFLLPSRLILYNSKDLDNESTKIVTYRWSEEIFVQLPRVEIVKEHEIIQGLMGVFREQIKQKSPPKEIEAEESPPEVMGFVIGADINEKKIMKTEALPTLNVTLKSAKSPPIEFSQIVNKLSSLSKKLLALPKILSKKWMIITGFILIITGVLLNEWLFHKATLTLYLPSKEIKKDFDLTADDIALEMISKTADVADSKSTSGKKEVGEKAHGAVTIHNFDDQEKTFAKGTLIETSGLKFSLDQEAKVASASVVTVNGGLVKQPGKAKINVSAEVIGPQSNLASGKQFTIGDFLSSLYFGINESSLAGGTKKDIKTVAKQDMEELQKSVHELAKKQKLGEINKNDTKSGQKFAGETKTLPQLSEITLTETKFDKEIGEEADKLNLQAKVQANIYIFKDKKVKDILLERLKKDLEKGFILQTDKLSYTVKKTQKEDKKINISVSSNGMAVQNVSSPEIINQVKGKNMNLLEPLLKDKFKIQGFEIEIEPKLPLLQNWLPFFAKNIKLIISSL